jgi:hypothetical protein
MAGECPGGESYHPSTAADFITRQTRPARRLKRPAQACRRYCVSTLLTVNHWRGRRDVHRRRASRRSASSNSAGRLSGGRRGSWLTSGWCGQRRRGRGRERAKVIQGVRVA